MQRRQHTAELKTRVVLKALNGELTTAQIAKQYGVHPLMVTKWKKHVVDMMPQLFARKADMERQHWQEREGELFRQIGQLQYELEWLKKKTAVFQ